MHETNEQLQPALINQYRFFIVKKVASRIAICILINKLKLFI